MTLITTLCSTISAVSQSYFYKRYGVQEGLPTEIIKAVAQDSLGFFWIATDEGLSIYDGIKFKSYTEILHSNYVKGFIEKSNGGLLVFGDLDLYEINNTGDTIAFDAVCPVSRVLNDSSVTYPKQIYEDQNNALWLSEAQSVVRLEENGFKRFEFDSKDRTTQFLRSFSIFEDLVGNLYVVSFQGNVFQLNAKNDVFESYKISFPSQVEYVGVFDQKLVIGASEGLFVSELDADGGFEPIDLAKSIQSVSFVKAINDDQYFIATRGKEHYIANSDFSAFEALPYEINNINHVYVSGENDIWISSNEGLILLKENLFQTVSDQDVFMESVTEDPETGNIYYATDQFLFEYNPQTAKNTELLDFANGYFQSLSFTGDGLWVANAFKAFLYDQGVIEKEFDFGEQRRFVTEITQDSSGNVWLSIPGHSYSYQIDQNYDLKKYPVPLGEDGVINLVKEGDRGIYIASSGNDSYLFHKSPEDSMFSNISAPLGFEVKSNIEITGLTSLNDKIYLASSVGLLVHDGNTLNKVNLGEEFQDLPVRSIEEYVNGRILIANAYGLLMYDLKNGTVDLFNESYGLSSRTITANGIMVSSTNDVWVCTSQGLCYSSYALTQSKETLTPKFIEVSVNGEPSATNKEVQMDYGSFISMEVSSITFPESDVNYQYRLDPSKDWINTDQEILISNLPSGKHELQVRAKKYGPFTWSDVNSVIIDVNPPYWHSGWFVVIVVLGILGLIALTYSYVAIQNRRKNHRLQVLINEKTSELLSANKDLKLLNDEKNNLIQIVAHDLKSPLAQIMSASDLVKKEDLNETDKKLTEMIKLSSSHLMEMINKILDVSQIESKELDLNIQSVNLTHTILQVANQYESYAKKKEIQIIKEVEMDVYGNVDEGFTKQIIDNLISNALKFSPKKSKVIIKLIENQHKAILEIKDEGPGLSADDKEKLFGKFQRLSAKPTANESSTGLGLSIVKKFVTAQKGDVWVESEKGKGASFFVALPKA
ncbi:ATP-binding protein [Ekhidna sp.]|uniref:sensor histidine kinase n=1 Tax=Ekhidna sp. TaxID=2608089 RepID=UPI003CCC26E8